MPTTLKRANVKVKVDGQFQDLGLLQSDVATQLTNEIAERKSNDNSLEANKIPYPLSPNSKYGNPGDVLRTDGEGGTKWVPIGLPTDEQIQDTINNWLDEHPEATTTVENGSLTEAKFSDELKLKTIKDYVTPEMFGAVGDGETNDTQAFKNMMAYVLENMDFIENIFIHAIQIFFGPKTYLINEDAFEYSKYYTRGLEFIGSGLSNSIIKVSNPTGAYLFDTGDRGGKQKEFVFRDLQFDLGETGKLIRLYSSNDNGKHTWDNGFKFFNCKLTGAVLLCSEGNTNGDRNRFNNCSVTSYESAIILNNSQSVANYFYNCSFSVYGGNVITVKNNGGGDVALTNCSIMILEKNSTDTTPKYLLNTEESNGNGMANGSFNFNNCRVEMVNSGALVKTAENTNMIYVQFNSCQFLRRTSSTPQADRPKTIEAHRFKTIVLNGCVLGNGLSYYADGNKIGDTTNPRFPGTIIFEKCIIPSTGLRNACSIDTMGRIICKEAIYSSSQANGLYVNDFDIGWSSYAFAHLPPVIKTVLLTPYNASVIHTVNFPEGAYIHKIYAVSDSGTGSSYNVDIIINSSVVCTVPVNPASDERNEYKIDKFLQAGSNVISINSTTLNQRSTTFKIFCEYI